MEILYTIATTCLGVLLLSALFSADGDADDLSEMITYILIGVSVVTIIAILSILLYISAIGG